MNGIGAHEVIVETPDHMQSLSTISLKGVEDALWAYYQRLNDLRKDKRLKYVLIFKNEGEAAGASLKHSHTQLIGLPIVPKLVKEETDAAKRYYDLKERCIFCDVISQELDSKKRVIFENARYVAIAPFAPSAPFETWILPKKHESGFYPPENSFALLAEIRIVRDLSEGAVSNFFSKRRPFSCPQLPPVSAVSIPVRGVCVEVGLGLAAKSAC